MKDDKEKEVKLDIVTEVTHLKSILDSEKKTLTNLMRYCINDGFPESIEREVRKLELRERGDQDFDMPNRNDPDDPDSINPDGDPSSIQFGFHKN